MFACSILVVTRGPLDGAMAKGVAPAEGEEGGRRYTKQFSKKLRRRAEEAAAAVSEGESGEEEDEDGEDEEEEDGEELAESSDEGEEEDEVAVPTGRAAKAQRAAKGKQPRRRGSEFVDDAAAEDEARCASHASERACAHANPQEERPKAKRQRNQFVDDEVDVADESDEVRRGTDTGACLSLPARLTRAIPPLRTTTTATATR